MLDGLFLWISSKAYDSDGPDVNLPCVGVFCTRLFPGLDC